MDASVVSSNLIYHPRPVDLAARMQDPRSCSESSSLSRGTRFKSGNSAVGSALALGARGRGIDSHFPD